MLLVAITILFLSQSRGPLLALIASLMTLNLIKFRSLLFIFLLMGGILFSISVVFNDLYGNDLIERYLLIGSLEDQSSTLRFIFIREALEIFFENPFLGKYRATFKWMVST